MRKGRSTEELETRSADTITLLALIGREKRCLLLRVAANGPGVGGPREAAVSLLPSVRSRYWICDRRVSHSGVMEAGERSLEGIEVLTSVERTVHKALSPRLDNFRDHVRS